MQKSERKQICKAIRLIHTASDYDTGMKLLCGLAGIQSVEMALTDTTQPVSYVVTRSRATRGKWCVCGHGLGAHRNSAGAMETFCRTCNCTQYQFQPAGK